MPTIAIVGKPYLSFIRYVAEHHPEIKLVAFHDQKDTNRYPETVTQIFSLDFSTKSTMEEGIKNLPPLHIDGFVSSYESSNLLLVWLGDYFKCPVPTEAAISAATDKTLMRQKFMDYDPSITPHFRKVETWEEVKDFAEKHQFPLVLKPANLMKSLLVTINYSLSDLEQNFYQAQNIIGKLYQEYGVFHRQPVLIIEEFLDGTSHSIDIISDKNGVVTPTPVVDYVTARQRGVEDTYVYARNLPSMLSQDDQAAITECAINGVKALGLTNTAAHTEIILTKQGPKIVEIGARFGGYRPRMYELHTGLDIHQAMINLALGKTISLTPNKLTYISIYEVFPDTTGVIESITGLEEVPKLKSFISLSQPKKPGDLAGLSKDGYKFCVNIILHSQNADQLAIDKAFVENNVKVVLET